MSEDSIIPLCISFLTICLSLQGLINCSNLPISDFEKFLCARVRDRRRSLIVWNRWTVIIYHKSKLKIQWNRTYSHHSKNQILRADCTTLKSHRMLEKSVKTSDCRLCIINWSWIRHVHKILWPLSPAQPGIKAKNRQIGDIRAFGFSSCESSCEFPNLLASI